MKKIMILLLLCLPSTRYLYSQSSNLVHLGASGKLEYATYANFAQTNAVNTIPDFSFCGYKMGGVQIPYLPVKETVTPASGDAGAIIQAAIDRVSLLPSDPNGYRGAVLIKSGRYEISAPLFVRASGVVIRGEGQNTADKGGTELVFTSSTQQDFIQVIGSETSVDLSSETTLDTGVYPSVGTWQSFNVLNGVNDVLDGDGIITCHIVATENQFVNYSSKEDSSHIPKLNIVVKLNTTGKDSVISLAPIADAFVQGGTSTNINFGSSTSLAIKNNGVNNNVTREAYLEFDLSTVNDSVKAANLVLYTKKDLAADTAATKVVHVIVSYISSDAWDEMAITYANSRPANGAADTKRITTSYLPTGASSFSIDNSAGLNIGDTIRVTRTPNDTWITTLDMAQYGWIASSYTIGYERKITEINGNTLTIDIPLVQTIEDLYGGGEITKSSVSGRLSNCGIENMLLTSVFTSDTAEDHGWSAVTLSYTTDSWVRKVTARYFGYSCVKLDYAFNSSIEECAMLDPKSITTGGRKYSFNIDKGSFNLFQRCYARGGRHDFVLGSRVAGPNAFVDCFSEVTYADIGPHQRYSTGTLFDNIQGGETRVQNRKDMGTGHGWAGAQTMFWNCISNAGEFKVESPTGALNWGIGCKGLVQSGAGFWESWGTQVIPRSLYFQQLKDRLGEIAVNNISLATQQNGDIWTSLKQWKGIGDFSAPLAGNNDNAYAPLRYSLDQNYPNPFNPETIISYSLPISGFVSLKVFDILGKEVVPLVNEFQKSGSHSTKLNINKSGLTSGVYFYSLRVNGYVAIKKMIVVK